MGATDEPMPPPLPPKRAPRPWSRTPSLAADWIWLASTVPLSWQAKHLAFMRIADLIVVPAACLYLLVWLTRYHYWGLGALIGFAVVAGCVALLTVASQLNLVIPIWFMTRVVVQNPQGVLGRLSHAQRTGVLRELRRYSPPRRLSLVGRMTDVDRLIAVIEATPSGEVAAVPVSEPATPD